MSEKRARSSPKRAAGEESVVREAYLRRITGYDVTETRSEFKLDDEGRRVLVRETETTKHVPGDPRAAEFWLANRQPKEWKHPRYAAQTREEPEDTGVVQLPEVKEDDHG